MGGATVRGRGTMLHRVAVLLTGLTLLVLLAMVADLVVSGLPVLSWRFVLNAPRELEVNGGVGPEILNTLTMVFLALAFTLPLALAAAILRVEYGESRGWRREFDRVTRTFLSVPSVVMGLVVYRLLVAGLGWPLSVITGTVALALFNWPFMVVVAQDALQGVPDAIREGSLALGATRFQTLVRAVMPAAMPTLVDGAGMALARLMGESAALVFTAGVNVSAHWGLLAPGETLAVHVWYIRTEGIMADAPQQAAATGVVLLALVFFALWSSQRVAGWLRQRS